jgi:hypothetical protein
MKKKEKRVALSLAIIIIVAAAIVAYAVISAKPSTWLIDAQLSNSGHQDTTEFIMNNTWRIIWTINKQNDNLFILAVYMKNDTGYSWLTDTSETDTNTTQGILPVRYTGTFIIRVVASDETEWTLFIEELKPA